MKFRYVGERDVFKRRLSKFRDLLTPPALGKKIDNLSLLSELFDAVESRTVQEVYTNNTAKYTYYNNKLCSLSIIDTNPPVRCIADRFVEFDLLL